MTRALKLAAVASAVLLSGCAHSPQAAFRSNYASAQRRAAAGDANGAIAAYREALRIDPASPEAHNNLGALLYDVGRTEEAVVEYERALQLDPDLAEAHNNLGVALLSTGRTAQAVAQFRRALERKPAFSDARFNLCLGLEILGQVEEAFNQCQALAEREPSRPGLADAVERLQRKRSE